MRKLLCYTRKPIDEFYYDPRLAYSMHLALEINGKVQALNHNSGVLFPLATENANGSLNPKCLKHPYIFNMNNDTFGVIAVRTDGEGNEDCESKGCVIVFESKDLLEYKIIKRFNFSHSVSLFIFIFSLSITFDYFYYNISK